MNCAKIDFLIRLSLIVYCVGEQDIYIFRKRRLIRDSSSAGRLVDCEGSVCPESVQSGNWLSSNFS